ncbi:molybdate ABC transporter, permease protein [Xenococcus sp. PCC 7305]|uniref:molybdate ABC transporter permease subunit n=1 Tax=Xenococcus sp. PCC 7305 TaxID=102125 RepID=UPI0002AC5979|nr:molybdate ABC transporter permease subunit [Xenococcus sp. PCC 7305]ELS00741.1 molybdate ABC transporter, permease protein [Xenococcus sp. PCC 7305]
MTNLIPIWISLKTATTATIITFFFGIIAAWWMLNYQGKSKGLIEGALTAPLVLPPTVVGFLLLLILGKNGFIGQLLDNFGITVIFSWYATVIASTVVAFPLMYKTALGAFRQIDSNLLACARTLGASEWTVFWRIILPLAKPGLIAGTLLAFARALGEFGATLMLAGSIPGRTETIPIAIFFAVEGGEMDRALLLVIIMLAISLGVIMATYHWTEGSRGSRGSRGHFGFIDKVITDLDQRKPISHQQKSLDYPVPKAKIELTVDIQKQLPGFLLDVSFKTDQTPLGLLGGSGAGKSLILRCIAGLEQPDRGRIVLNGRVLFDSARGINLPPRDRGCGFLFQNYALFPHLTIAENIAFGLPRSQSPRAIKQEVEQQLIAVDLPGISDRYPTELSGGQQQRVALARAKASKPGIMLLDEPFSALDTYLRDKQEKLLRNNLITYQGVTLFITHNLEEAYRVCPNLLVIDRGQAIAQGTKQDIFEHPRNFKTAQLTGCKNFSRAVAISDRQVKAIDWGCIFEVIEPLPTSLEYVGIRAHQLILTKFEEAPLFQDGVSLTDSENEINNFPCWLATISETQHRMTLYLKLNQPANHPEDYHLQAEVFKDKWVELKDHPLPWKIQFNPLKIIVI